MNFYDIIQVCITDVAQVGDPWFRIIGKKTRQKMFTFFYRFDCQKTFEVIDIVMVINQQM